MRNWMTAALVTGLAVVGCQPSGEYTGPKVDGFNGRLVADGKPVQFGADETVELQLMNEKGQELRVPIKPDGSFELKWMPTGKFAAKLSRVKSGGGSGKKGSSAPSIHNLAGGFEIKEGQTEYTVELGKGFKP